MSTNAQQIWQLSLWIFDLVVGGGLPEIPLVSVIGNTESVNWRIPRSVRSAGFEVEVFTSAEQFLGAGQMPSTACLVLDVHLQGLSGFQLQSHLASASRHIPIIFLTTSTDQSARAVALKAGAVNVLDNPSGSEALLREIRLVLKPGARRKDELA